MFALQKLAIADDIFQSPEFSKLLLFSKNLNWIKIKKKTSFSFKQILIKQKKN
jgi:hypothetical protein